MKNRSPKASLIVSDLPAGGANVEPPAAHEAALAPAAGTIAAPGTEPAPPELWSGVDPGPLLATLLATGANCDDAMWTILAPDAPDRALWRLRGAAMADPARTRNLAEALLEIGRGLEQEAVPPAIDLAAGLADATWLRSALERNGLWGWTGKHIEAPGLSAAQPGGTRPGGLARGGLMWSMRFGWREPMGVWGRSKGQPNQRRPEAQIRAEDELQALMMLGHAAKVTPDAELPNLVGWLARRGIDPLCVAMAGAVNGDHLGSSLNPALAQALAARLGADPWWAERIQDVCMDISGRAVTELPAGLRLLPVGLEANCCPNLRRLPQGLAVIGNVNLDDCGALEELPAGLVVVGGALFLNRCAGLWSLPSNLTMTPGSDFGLEMCGRPPLPLPAGANLGSDLIRSDAFGEAVDNQTYLDWAKEQGL